VASLRVKKLIILNMEIAKGITAEDYLKLDLTDKKSPNWDIAFEYLKLRLTERFIEPTDKLTELESELSAGEKKYGFAVLAIDCLLSETIQAFYEGITDSSGESKRLFKAFLQQRDNFKQHFTDEQQATDFYINFRCGILHQAQTSANTKIWAVGDLIMRKEKFVIVNRELYHKKVKDELDIYLKKLKEKNDIKLLNNFKTKMDFIAGK
jgi:hypothetical protein